MTTDIFRIIMYIIILIIWKGVDIMTKKAGKILAVLLVFSFVFVMIFSSAFVILHSNHRCVTNHCRICCQIANCQNNFSVFSYFLVLITILLFFAALIFISKRIFSDRFYHPTLILLKVKLSNWIMITVRFLWTVTPYFL